ncbi:MAG: DUF1549 and DUF1553 domain-containing protein [Gemmataceae bacterium]
MHGPLTLRLLGGLFLATSISVLAGDAPPVGGQAPDATKKTSTASSLPSGQKLSATQLARHLDRLILETLHAEKTEPSPRCSDEEFVRRVYLDLTGKIPTAEQALAFLDSREANKRAQLIDELLASKEYGRHLADIWQTLLLPRNSDNRRLLQYYEHLTKWMETKFNANTPWNEMVQELLTAKGDVTKNGPVIYWVANNTADKVTDSVSKVFLGVQLQCAQCHNHPFTGWKQDEYWGMAAFFLHVRPEGNPKAAAKNGGTISIAENPQAKRGKRQVLPESARIVAPKFLQGEKPTVKSGAPVRPVLASWMTTPQNPFFAKAMVNRVWWQLFGRGLVNPVDDMHEGNAASHPQLLADLTQQFAASGFDLKHLFRTICNSETYQRSSKPTGSNGSVGPELYARMAIKPLSPEQMYDSLASLLGGEARPNAARKNKQQAQQQKGGANARAAFVAFFSADEGADPTEYQAGIPQVLRLMNSAQFNNFGRLAGSVRSSTDVGGLVEKLYLNILARRPTSVELERTSNYLRRGDDRREAIAGVIWALVNSSEFALNR